MLMMALLHSAAKLKALTTWGSMVSLASFVSYQTIADPLTQNSTVERILEKSALFALCVGLIWVGRRDEVRRGDFWKDEAGRREAMIRESTAAQTSVAAALSANTVVVHQAKRVMEELIPMRRADERG